MVVGERELYDARVAFPACADAGVLRRPDDLASYLRRLREDPAAKDSWSFLDDCPSQVDKATCLQILLFSKRAHDILYEKETFPWSCVNLPEACQEDPDFTLVCAKEMPAASQFASPALLCSHEFVVAPARPLAGPSAFLRRSACMCSGQVEEDHGRRRVALEAGS